MHKNTFRIFVCFFIIRVVFAFALGFFNNYNSQPDSIDLMRFADRAVGGDFNFDFGRFIASPLFPVFAALHKILLPGLWRIALILSQITLSSLSGVYLYKIACTVFKNESVAITTVVIYAVFPFTMWYVHTFSQETLFQSLFVISVYHLIRAYQSASQKSLIYSAVLFSLAYLTKSHVLLYALFIPLIFWINIKPAQTAMRFSVIYAAICLLFSLPFGLYNEVENHTYVLSSNGSGFQFYLGNTNAGYISVVEVPKKESEDYLKMKDITVTAGYFNGDTARYAQILAMSQSTKQSVFFKESLTWIKQNPTKWLKMKIYDVGLYLIPGVSFRHYSFGQWLLALVFSLPLYIFGWIGAVNSLRTDFKAHFYFLAIFLSMFLFSVVFYVQNRFRTITLEPFLILYAASSIQYFYQSYLKGKNTVQIS